MTLEILVDTAELKKAIAISALAVLDTVSSIQSHALVKFDKKKANSITVFSTDKDKMTLSTVSVSNSVAEDELVEFTLDPKKIQALISNLDVKQIKVSYDKSTKTVCVYTTEESDAYVTLASFDPEEFLNLEKQVLATQEIKTFDADMLKTALKFIQGILSTDAKDKRYSNLYFDKGVIYGSNGHNKVGAFISDVFKGVSDIMIRGGTIPPITSMLDRISCSTIKFKSSDKLLVVATPDDSLAIGFVRTVMPMPRMPINLEVPQWDGFNVEKTPLIKKINRLSVVSKEGVGLKLSLSTTTLFLETETERVSKEKISSNRLRGESDLVFYLNSTTIKSMLGLFQASDVDIYVGDSKMMYYSNASICVEENGVETKKPFTSIGLTTLARK